MSEKVTKAEVLKDIQKVRENLSQTGSAGRPVTRPDQIQRGFEGHEEDTIPVSKLAEQFPKTNDPKVNAQTAVSWLNKQLIDVGSDLEIYSELYYGWRKRKKD